MTAPAASPALDPATVKLSPSFTLAEFAVSAEFPELVRPVPAALVPRVRELATRALQPIRDAIGRPIKIISGYRHDALNRAIGGSPTSQHVVGEAADFTCHDIRSAWLTVLDLVRDSSLSGVGQLIVYPNQRFIHVALASGRYPRATPCVHWPAKGYEYRIIRPDRRTYAAMVPQVSDPSAPGARVVA